VRIAMPSYRTFDVSVAGGTLHVGMWGTNGPFVLGSHGITGNHVSFEALADQLGEGFRLVAPDHRGRGRSRDIQGPWGMRAHAADLVAVLDHLAVDRADVLVGQSMGGFVAAVTTAEHGERIGSVLMVDGGLPLMNEIPQGLTIEQLILAVIGPAMSRLDMTFESREAYREFWRKHPAISGSWSAYVERYLDYDLVGEPPNLRPTASKEAILRDTESQLLDDLVPRSLVAMHGPVRFLRAPRGILDDAPLYTEERLETWGSRIDRFTTTTIPDVNHYTILLSEHGAKAVAGEVRELLV
jgi:lipase